MTRDEARRIISIWLEWLEESKDLDGQRGYIEGHFSEEDVEAFRMAIKALSQPIVCKDYCIDDDHIYCSPKVAEMVVETFSAQPYWIPCSKRLPRYDETSEYLVTDKDGRVRHCCLDPYMPETFVTVEEGMIVDAVAWRPAPEPYCKTESHEREGK